MLAFLLTGHSSFHRASKVLGWAVAFPALPPGYSSWRSIRQNQLETSLKSALPDRTLTFERLVLVGIDTNWPVTPLEVRLPVRSDEAVTPRQIELLANFLDREMGQKFVPLFDVSQIQEVRAGR
jgi:hypothetical protein